MCDDGVADDGAPDRGTGERRKRRSEETVEETRCAKVVSEKGFDESETREPKTTEKKVS